MSKLFVQINVIFLIAYEKSDPFQLKYVFVQHFDGPLCLSKTGQCLVMPIIASGTGSVLPTPNQAKLVLAWPNWALCLVVSSK